MTHDELRELIPVFALDAVDGDDEQEVRAHLESCSPCQTLLDGHIQAAAGLALLADPVAPPAELRARLLDGLEAAPQSAPVVQPARHRYHWSWWQRLAAVATVAALVALGAFGIVASHRLGQRNKTLAAQARFFQSLASPLASAVPLTGAGNAANASGVLYLSPDGRTAGLVARGLAAPGRKVYQLWLIADNQPSPVVAFRPDATGLALVSVHAKLGGMQGMAVTLENRAGNSKPQGPFVLHT